MNHSHDPNKTVDEMRKWWKEHEKNFDFKAAAERRGREGGGPKAKPGDGKSPDTGAKPGDGEGAAPAMK